MTRKAVWLLLFFFAKIGPLASAVDQLKVEDIPRVMERLFNFHIEAKDYNPTIVRRSMKIYVEQFDPEKIYLLEEEAAPYLHLSEQKAAEIAARLQRKDYSDFFALNQLLQKAVYRAQNLRKVAAESLLRDEASKPSVNGGSSQFARSEKELMERQKNRLVRFYLYHQSRSRLNTFERKQKVVALFERKVQRQENNYLFLNVDGSAMAKERVEHLLTLRVVKSLAKSLDTHTSFFSPEEAYEMRLNLEKQFDGVGVVLSEGVDGVMIAELIKGSPAEQSGQIQVNDVLVEIDGKQTAQISFEEVLDILKKKDRGEIILGFKRPDLQTHNDQSFKVSLRKRPIVMNEERIQTSFERTPDGIIGKISLHSFYETSDGMSSEKDIKEAIRSFRQQGELKGLVLDLRENSGGFLSQAVKVAGLFVSNGVIVISKYGKGEVHYLRNIVGRSLFNGPLVVLTSKMSASAAEIVAQALQDYGVGLIVGDERTFGKGSIQYQTLTDERSDLFFKVTVGRYYTVSGKSPQVQGVMADIVVPTQYAPYKIGEKYLEYPLPADQIEAAYNDPLTDLDERTRYIFQKRYMPYLQRPVSFWKKQLPLLKQNSARRIAQNPEYQTFLQKQEKVKQRLQDLPANTIDENAQFGIPDIQMNEAVHIVKDMIQIEAQNRPAAELFLKTGSD